MIYRLLDNGNRRMTTWTDEPIHVIEAAKESIFGKHHDVIGIESERHGKITFAGNDSFYTTDEVIKNAALNLGYWVEYDNLLEAWELYLTWTTDPKNAPNNAAVHLKKEE